MKPATWYFLATLALCCVCATIAHADNSLTMQANTPEVNIELRSAKRNFLRLPALQFAFVIDAVCVKNLTPVSLQLSVADTRKTLQGDEIEAGAATTISLNIPANQIAPVVIQGFCERPDSQESDGQQRNEQTRITIPAALSAQASLRCSSEADTQTVYVSRPLDVILACKPREN